MEFRDPIVASYLGIAMGITVFFVTIVSVCCLLAFGGSFDRLRNEVTGLTEDGGASAKPVLDSPSITAARKRLEDQSSVELKGKKIILRTLDVEKGLVMLHQTSNGSALGGMYGNSTYNADRLIWKFLSIGPFSSSEALKEKLQDREKISTVQQFVILEKESEKIIGYLLLSDISVNHLSCKVEEVWVTPSFQGTGAAQEAIYLLLKFLIDTIGYRRVTYECDGQSLRARKAAHSMGWTLEGVLRKHAIVKGCNRDTALFSILNTEWPVVKIHLESKLKKDDDEHDKIPEKVMVKAKDV